MAVGLEKNFPNREQPMWAPEEQVPAEPGEGRATDCGGEPMGAGSHRRIKGVLYDQICILKDDFSCYGNWGRRNWRNHVAAATLLGEL